MFVLIRFFSLRWVPFVCVSNSEVGGIGVSFVSFLRPWPMISPLQGYSWVSCRALPSTLLVCF